MSAAKMPLVGETYIHAFQSFFRMFEDCVFLSESPTEISIVQCGKLLLIVLVMWGE